MSKTVILFLLIFELGLSLFFKQLANSVAPLGSPLILTTKYLNLLALNLQRAYQKDHTIDLTQSSFYSKTNTIVFCCNKCGTISKPVSIRAYLASKFGCLFCSKRVNQVQSVPKRLATQKALQAFGKPWLGLTGSKHPKYTGESNRINVDPEFRRQVAANYNWRCFLTNTKASAFNPCHAHHLIPISVNPLLKNDPRNGVFINAFAHRKFHALYGCNATVEDFEQFARLFYNKQNDSFKWRSFFNALITNPNKVKIFTENDLLANRNTTSLKHRAARWVLEAQNMGHFFFGFNPKKYLNIRKTNIIVCCSKHNQCFEFNLYNYKRHMCHLLPCCDMTIQKIKKPIRSFSKDNIPADLCGCQYKNVNKPLHAYLGDSNSIKFEKYTPKRYVTKYKRQILLKINFKSSYRFAPRFCVF